MPNRKKTKSRTGMPQAARRYGNPIKESDGNATSVPGPLDNTVYSAKSNIDDETTAPLLESESVGSQHFASNKWAILDKYLLRKFNLPILLTMIICGGLFIQDNGAGKLTDWKAITWTLTKCCVVTGLFLALILTQWLSQKIIKRS